MYTSNAATTAHNYDVILNGAGVEAEEVMFKTMSDVKAKNKEIGHLFFDPDTMKFWDSKVESTLYKGTYFITSEKNAIEGKPRQFSIRQVLRTGEIITVGRGREYSSLESARDAVKELVKRLPAKKKS